MNDSKSPDRWTGDFEFNIESTFDLSNCISSNTCKDQLLYETIDHVADLKAHFQVFDLKTLIKMPLSEPNESQYFMGLFSDPTCNPILLKTFNDIKQCINMVDINARGNKDQLELASEIFVQVW